MCMRKYELITMEVEEANRRRIERYTTHTHSHNHFPSLFHTPARGEWAAEDESLRPGDETPSQTYEEKEVHQLLESG